jgi:hypothetical protein
MIAQQTIPYTKIASSLKTHQHHHQQQHHHQSRRNFLFTFSGKKKIVRERNEKKNFLRFFAPEVLWQQERVNERVRELE